MIMTSRYDELDKTALQILMDYSNAQFPLDLINLCERLRIKLVPYSSLGKSKLSELRLTANNGELTDGFSILLGNTDCDGYSAYTYYNDDKPIDLSGRVCFTICHEIKHVVFGEIDPRKVEETEADHFARFLLAPTPLLIVEKYDSISDIHADFGLTMSAACNALDARNNRIKKHGETLFDYENDFIDWFLENNKKRRSGENDAIQNYDSSLSTYCYSPDTIENQQNTGGYDNADI